MLSVYLKHAVCDEDADPGAVIAIQSFGDYLGFHPHAHMLITDGPEASFRYRRHLEKGILIFFLSSMNHQDAETLDNI